MDAINNLSVPGYAAMDGSDEASHTIFVSSDDHSALLALSNSPSLNTEDNEDDIDVPQNNLLGLTRTVSMEIPMRASTLLEDITSTKELTQLKFELSAAKEELANNETKLKKSKAEGEFLGVLKSTQKQRSSMKHLQMNYESELEQIHSKLMRSQKTHISQISKFKKAQTAQTLEIKLKNLKIKELSALNEKMRNDRQQNESDLKAEIERLKREFDSRIESEINKRIEQIRALKQERFELNECAMDEKDKLIKKLEMSAQRDRDMFDKHSEIFDYKLERESKEKKRLQKEILEQKIEFETDLKALQTQLNEAKECNMHLQNKLRVVISENHDLTHVQSENQKLRVSVNSHNQTIKELQNLMKQSSETENECEFETQKESHELKSETEKASKHSYQTSYMSMDADHELKLRHFGELESIKGEYNALIEKMNGKHSLLEAKYVQCKTELETSEKLVAYLEQSKVDLATNFATEMNRIREIIAQQNRLKRTRTIGTDTRTGTATVTATERATNLRRIKAIITQPSKKSLFTRLAFSAPSSPAQAATTVERA